MPAKQVILDQMRQSVLPLFYHNDVTIIGVQRALYAAGIRTVEYTNRGEAALALISGRCGNIAKRR